MHIPCNYIHSGFNSGNIMRWECASNLNWEGDFSGCTFKENWENPLALLYYSVVVDPLEALGNRSAFEASVSVILVYGILYTLFVLIAYIHVILFWKTAITTMGTTIIT